jgi:isoprenylcysteine carboxyl methyltransferase (ICMT) family protein YpbQ
MQNTKHYLLFTVMAKKTLKVKISRKNLLNRTKSGDAKYGKIRSLHGGANVIVHGSSWLQLVVSATWDRCYYF